MKYAEINTRYTEIVTEYMTKGYTVNTSSMGGSQGEIAKIDLTDGNEIIRILVTSFHDWRNDVEGIEIIVGKSTDDVKPHSNGRHETIWDNRLEVVHSERFYQIGRYGNDYYGTEDDAKRASEVRSERYERRHIASKKYEASEKAMEIAYRVVRTKFGYKRINTADVKLSKSDRGYFVTYRNNTYKLH